MILNCSSINTETGRTIVRMAFLDKRKIKNGREYRAEAYLIDNIFIVQVWDSEPWSGKRDYFARNADVRLGFGHLVPAKKVK